MTEGDLPDVARWVNTPHVAKWWDEQPHARAGRRLLRAGHPRRGRRCGYWIWEVNGRSVGFCQDYRIADHPEYALLCGRPDAIGFDYVIGEAALRRPRSRHQPALGVPARHRRPGVRRGDASCSPPPTTATPGRCGCWRSSGATAGDVVRRAAVRRRRRHGRRVQHRRAPGTEVGMTPRRHLGLELPAVARRLLPEGPAAAPRAGVRRLAADLDRDQRLLLLAAATVELGEVARGGARRLRVRGQGRPLHHPHEAPPRRRGAAGQLLRPGRARPRTTRSGPILWQLPATFAYDETVLARVLRPAPAYDDRGRPARHRGTTTGSPATSCGPARWPNDRCATPSSRGTTASRPTRRWRSSTECDVALVVADSAGKWPRFEQAVGPIVYARLHGDTELYASGYTDAALDRWAEQLARLDRRRARRLRLLRQRHEGLRAARRARLIAKRLGASGVRLPTAGSPAVDARRRVRAMSRVVDLYEKTPRASRSWGTGCSPSRSPRWRRTSGPSGRGSR